MEAQTTMTPTNDSDTNLQNMSSLDSVWELAKSFDPDKIDEMPEMKERWTAYISVAVFDALTESVGYYVEDLIENVNDKEHNERLKEIQGYVTHVQQIRRDCRENMKGLYKILRKITYFEGNPPKGLYNEFDNFYEIIASYLNICTAQLVKAKNELEEGFDSIKRYKRSREIAAMLAKIALLARSAFTVTKVLLLPLIRTSFTTVGDVALHTRLSWRKITQQLDNALGEAHTFEEKYRDLQIVTRNLDIDVLQMRGQMQAHGSSRKQIELQERNIVLEKKNKQVEDENNDLKVQHVKDKERMESMEAEHLEDKEEIRRLKEQLSSRSMP